MRLRPKIPLNCRPSNPKFKIRRRRIVGLVRYIGNVVYGQPYQGFESLRLRQYNSPPTEGCFYAAHKNGEGFRTIEFENCILSHFMV